MFYVCVSSEVIFCEESSADNKGHWMHGLLNNIGRRSLASEAAAKEIVQNERAAETKLSLNWANPDKIIKPHTYNRRLLAADSSESSLESSELELEERAEERAATVHHNLPESLKPLLLGKPARKVSRPLNQAMINTLLGKPAQKPTQSGTKQEGGSMVDRVQLSKAWKGNLMGTYSGPAKKPTP